MHGRFHIGMVGLACIAAGCATRKPPALQEIHLQGFGQVALTNAWTAVPGLSTNDTPDGWLASFGDETLLALVAEAQSNNLDIAVTSARLEQAEGYVKLAKASLRPSLNLFGSGGLKSGGGDMSSGLLGALLGASWELDLWGRLRYARNAAQADYEAFSYDLQYARQSLAASVARSWFVAAETYRQKQLLQEVATAAEDFVALTEKRQTVGAGNQLDSHLAQANLGSAQDSLQQAELAHANARRALELLLGRYPGAELKSRTDLPALPPPVPIGLPLRMLERRPDFVAAERRVAAAFNRVGEAKAARLPSIALNASVATLSSDVLELKEDYENPSSGAGARLMAPVYKGGGMVAQVDIRTAEQKAAVADYARVALRAINDVESGLASAKTLRDRQTLLAGVVENNAKALELVDRAYRVGQQDLRNVLQQHVDLLNAQLTLLSVQNEQLIQRVNLYLALGGGF